MPKTISKKSIKTIVKKKTLKSRLSAKEVLTYLQSHPQFLKTHASQLIATGSAQAPKKVANIFSLQAARAGDAENKLKALKKRHAQLIAIAKANAEATAQAHAAVLALWGAPTSHGGLSKVLQGPFRQILGLHAARMLSVRDTESATSLTEAGLTKLCPGPIDLGPYQASLHAGLFGPQGITLKSRAFLRLERNGQPVGLLALGSEDAGHFHAGQGTDLLEFLRQAASLKGIE